MTEFLFLAELLLKIKVTKEGFQGDAKEEPSKQTLNKLCLKIYIFSRYEEHFKNQKNLFPL